MRKRSCPSTANPSQHATFACVQSIGEPSKQKALQDGEPHATGQPPSTEGRSRAASQSRQEAAAGSSSIAAVLASHTQWRYQDCPDSDPSSAAGDEHAIQLQDCPAPLISCSGSLRVEAALEPDKAKLMHALWDVQLRAAKYLARADAARCLRSTHRAMRLQTKAYELSIRTALMQDQLHVM